MATVSSINPRSNRASWRLHGIIATIAIAWLITTECFIHVNCVVKIGAIGIIIPLNSAVTTAYKNRYARRNKHCETMWRTASEAQKGQLKDLVKQLTVLWITYQMLHAQDAKSSHGFSLFETWVEGLLDDATNDVVAWTKQSNLGAAAFNLTPATMLAHLSIEDAEKFLDQLHCNIAWQDAVDKLCTPEDEEQIKKMIEERNRSGSFLNYVPRSSCMQRAVVQ